MFYLRSERITETDLSVLWKKCRQENEYLTSQRQGASSGPMHFFTIIKSINFFVLFVLILYSYFTELSKLAVFSIKQVIQHLILSYGWCSVLLGGKIGSRCGYSYQRNRSSGSLWVLFSRLLSFVYWRTWQFMKGLQNLVMKKPHLYADTVHEVDGCWLNTWNHLCAYEFRG